MDACTRKARTVEPVVDAVVVGVADDEVGEDGFGGCSGSRGHSVRPIMEDVLEALLKAALEATPSSSSSRPVTAPASCKDPSHLIIGDYIVELGTGIEKDQKDHHRDKS